MAGRGERRLVLASTSARRQELLGRLGVPFAVLDPAVDEPSPTAGADATAYAVAMARVKADAAVQRVLAAAALPAQAAEATAEAGLVDILTSDTTVALDSHILGKPADRDDALRILRTLSGSTHRVISSVSLRTVDLAARAVVEAIDEVDETRIRFRRLDEAEIMAYVESGESYGKAGAYAVQESGDRFVEELDGRFTTVVGLPLALVAELLWQRGYAVPRGQALDRLDRRVEPR